jgi:hydrogenase nickel incorporation protein HypA/HybF
MLHPEGQPVHELSLCDAIVGTTMKHTESTDLKGAELVIEQVPATVACLECTAETTLDMPILVCGACGSFDVRLLTGEEFLIVSMDVAEV